MRNRARRIRSAPCATLLALVLAGPHPVAAQECLWEGSSDETPPAVTPLRSYHQLGNAPQRVAADAEGTLFITEPNSGRVVILDSSGRTVETRSGFLQPHAIALDPTGLVVLAEQGDARVTIWDRQWSSVVDLGQGNDEFVRVADLALDPTPQGDSVYVVDGGADEVRVYGLDGAFRFAFGGPGSGPGELDEPTAIQVTRVGEVWVADPNNDRIQVYDLDGAFLRCVGQSEGVDADLLLGRVVGLTSDDEGRTYAADAFQGYLRVLDSEGLEIGRIGEFGSGPGELATPVGLAIDPFGRLFVASVNNGRLEAWGLDDFEDPFEATAEIDLFPALLLRSSPPRVVKVGIELRPFDLGMVDLASVTANGVLAIPDTWRRVDYDGDGVEELGVAFDAKALLTVLPDGGSDLMIAGDLDDGKTFVGSARVEVRPPPTTDRESWRYRR